MRHFLITLLVIIAALVPSSLDAFMVDGIYYNITGNYELMVTYKDNNYNSYSGDVIIPETVIRDGITFTVTIIGNHAFSNCSELASVSLPKTIKVIGVYAFNGCSALTSIDIPDSVVSIGSNAFENCSHLTSVNIPNLVTSLDAKNCRI